MVEYQMCKIVNVDYRLTQCAISYDLWWISCDLLPFARWQRCGHVPWSTYFVVILEVVGCILCLLRRCVYCLYLCLACHLSWCREGRLKMRDWNYRHHQKCRGGKCRTGNIGTMWHGVENAGLELSAPNCRGGKCGTKQLWKAKTRLSIFISVLLYYTL